MTLLFPTPRALAFFAVIAIACATVASLSTSREETLALFALPIFAVAMWLGMRRSGQWASLARPIVESESVEEMTS